MHWGACAKAGSDGYFGRMPGRRDCGEGSGRRLLCPACRRPRPWSCKDRQTDRQASKMAVGDHRPARGRKRKKTPLFHFPTRYDDGTDHLAGGIGRPRTRPRLASGPVTAGRPYSCLPGKSRHRGHGQILQPRLGLSHRLSFPRPLCTDAWCQSRRPWPRTTSCRGYPRSLLQWYFSFLFFWVLSHTHTHTQSVSPSLVPVSSQHAWKAQRPLPKTSCPATTSPRQTTQLLPQISSMLLPTTSNLVLIPSSSKQAVSPQEKASFSHSRPMKPWLASRTS